MKWIQQFFPSLSDPLASFAFWLGIAMFALFFLTWGIPFFTRKTKTEIDDILIGILRVPVTLMFLAYGILEASLHWDILQADSETIRKIFYIFSVIVTSLLFFRIINDVFRRFFTEFAQDSETNIDDVLAPLISSTGPLFIFVFSTMGIIYIVSPDLLSGFLTVAGALSFLLIFLFQEPLSNLFSGVYLWLGSPFQYGDYIMLEDDKTYRVEEIGTRVTRLYNTKEHTVAYFPNSKIASQRLINITRPNVELREGIDIGISYNTDSHDIQMIQDLLEEIANKHVHVLGSWEKASANHKSKRDIILQRINDESRDGQGTTDSLKNEFQRLTLEYRVREANQKIWEDLNFAAAMISDIERGGLNKWEKQVVSRYIADIKEQTETMRWHLTAWVKWSGLIQAVYKLSTASYHLPSFTDIQDSIIKPKEWRNLISSKDEDEVINWLLKNERTPPLGSLNRADEISTFGIGIFRQAFELTAQITTLKNTKPVQEYPAFPEKYGEGILRTSETFEDYVRLISRWTNPVRTLLRGLDQASSMLTKSGAAELGINEQLTKVARMFSDRFMLEVPGFKFPDADFQKFGESSLDFRLEFFVDDLVGDHFERSGDVKSEIGVMIKQEFDKRKIEIPFPQRDIWVRQ